MHYLTSPTLSEAKLGVSYTSREFLKVASHTFNLENKRYFNELAATLEEDPQRGDDEDDVDDGLNDEPDIPPEDLFHQSDDDIEVILNPNAGIPW